jgi:hypothetical protein
MSAWARKAVAACASGVAAPAVVMHAPFFCIQIICFQIVEYFFRPDLLVVGS